MAQKQQSITESMFGLSLPITPEFGGQMPIEKFRGSTPMGNITESYRQAGQSLQGSVRRLFGQQTPQEATVQKTVEQEKDIREAILTFQASNPGIDMNTPEALKKLANHAVTINPDLRMFSIQLTQRADALQSTLAAKQRKENLDTRLTESRITKNLATSSPPIEKGIKLTATQSMYAKALKKPDGSPYYDKDNPFPLYVSEIDQFAAETIAKNIADDKNAAKINEIQLRIEKQNSKDLAERAAKVSFSKNSIFKTKSSINKIEQAEELVKKTAQHIVGTTGAASFILKDIPSVKVLGFEGSPKKLENIIDSIKARLGFDEITKMRKDSPTGGALGQVTERELMFLQSVEAKLDTSLNSEDFLQVLQEVKNSYARLLQNEQENLKLLQNGYTQKQINEFTIQNLMTLGVKGINPQASVNSKPSLKPISEMTEEEIKQELGQQ